MVSPVSAKLATISPARINQIDQSRAKELKRIALTMERFSKNWQG